MFLLDTNIVSELRKPRPHGAVLQWAHAMPAPQLRISSITLFELQKGANATRKQDAVKAVEIDRWIDEMIQTFQVVSFDGNAARLTAELMEGTSTVLFEDAMIAAIARVNSLTLATRNVKDFQKFRVALVNPFLYQG